MGAERDTEGYFAYQGGAVRLMEPVTDPIIRGSEWGHAEKDEYTVPFGPWSEPGTVSAGPWVDDSTADLLSLVASGPMSGSADGEWDLFVAELRAVALWGKGRIDPNLLRSRVRDHVAPRRIGAFTSRALARGLVEYTGEWETSDDTEGRNSGKPCRVMRWVGGAL